MIDPNEVPATTPLGSAKVNASPTALTLKRIAIGTLLILAVWSLSAFFLLAFAAVLVAVALHGCGKWISERTGMPINVAIALVALSVFVLLALGIWARGPSLVDQVTQLWTQLQAAFKAVQAKLQDTTWGPALLDDLSGLNKFDTGQAVAGRIFGAAASTFGTMGSLLIVVATGIYLALDAQTYCCGLERLLPLDKRARGTEILLASGDTLRRWLVGRAIAMAAVIVVTYLGLWLLGVTLSFTLAVIAGLANFVPYIGAIVGAVPALLVAFGQGPELALWVAGLLAVIQFLEGYVLTPLIQNRTVAMPAAVTILSQVLFGSLFGVIGLILAPALMAVIQVVVQMAYVEDVLGDHAPSAITDSAS
jgi:predicted PurR-regulated permease PerM